MLQKIGIREFRDNLAKYLSGANPQTRLQALLRLVSIFLFGDLPLPLSAFPSGRAVSNSNNQSSEIDWETRGLGALKD